jgi:ankyrin repeat protein
MGLVLTSAQASQSGISGAMIDLLIEFGDSIDVRQPGVLVGSLVNHAPAAAAHLIRLGAKEDLFASAGLGRLENVQAAFEEDGKLKERQRWQGGFASSQDAIGLAMLVAYVQGCTEVVDFLLEKDGNWDVTGVNNGTALHQAAVAEDLEMVAKLVARGADASNRQNPFVASPISWADHFGLSEVTEWMGQHCRLDIHDAVSFGIHGQALLRLREDPASVNSRLDQWSIPQATPLHCAVVMKRVDMVELLLASGAEVNALAGNGLTALDLASQQEAPGILTQLLAAGGRRASEL